MDELEYYKTKCAGMEKEKERRIYYQAIVYAVCCALDRIDGKKAGEGIVCGTSENPSTEVQDRMAVLAEQWLLSSEGCDE